MTNFITVICVRGYRRSKLQQNNYYLLDLDSIWTDDMNRNLCDIYDFITQEFIGCYKIDRFIAMHTKKKII